MGSQHPPCRVPYRPECTAFGVDSVLLYMKSPPHEVAPPWLGNDSQLSGPQLEARGKLAQEAEEDAAWKTPGRPYPP